MGAWMWFALLVCTAVASYVCEVEGKASLGHRHAVHMIAAAVLNVLGILMLVYSVGIALAYAAARLIAG